MSSFCCVCGRTGPLHAHHVIFRSQGGEDGPTVPLCPDCHAHVHLRTLYIAESGEGFTWTRVDADLPLLAAAAAAFGEATAVFRSSTPA